MIQLNLDVVAHVVNQVSAFYSAQDRQAAFRNLAALSRDFAHTTRPFLFRSVRWPHPDKKDENGLQFFPETLWECFQEFHLDWPDYWPDATPPKWGAILLGEYAPKHLDKLESALPKMTRVHTLRITCPFHPPNSLLLAIVACPNIRDLRVTDTPYRTGISADALPVTFNLERLTFIPVGETNRVGEGPFDKKYYDIGYYTRAYRKRYWTDSHAGYTSRVLPGWALLHIFCLTNPDTLKYIQISGRYCTLRDFLGKQWPNLETLVLSGPELSQESVTLAAVVAQMPKLWDLRVLFLQTATANQARPSFVVAAAHDHAAGVFARIRHLAVSSVCSLDGAFWYFTSLERLALIAVINHPRIPIARSRENLNRLMVNLEETGSGKEIKLLRILMEDGLDAGLLDRLARVCPALAHLELEICGYRDGDDVIERTEYADALEIFKHLETLRIGIPFEGCDEADLLVDPEAFLRRGRHDFGNFLAGRVQTLRRIGFEFRLQTGSLRYEDRWMDFDVERLADGSIRLWEGKQTWYPFPEVWEPVLLQEPQ